MTLTTEWINNLPSPYVKEEIEAAKGPEMEAFYNSKIFADQLLMSILAVTAIKDPLEGLKNIILTSWHMGLMMGQMKNEVDQLEKMVR